MKIKKAGIFSKIVILILVVYATVSLVNLRTRVNEAEAAKDDLTREVQQKAAENDDLMYEIEHSSDPQTIENIAREKLGLLLPGEKVFYDVSN